MRLAAKFLDTRLRADGELDLHLDAAAVNAFVVAFGSCWPRAVARMVTALRSLLRFLHVDGILAGPLTVPSTAGWSLAGSPKALPRDHVERLLAACDRSTATGCRDYAVLLLLSRLGLRAGEVAALRLEDIDWHAGEITVRGKGNRHDRLPLPADVGTAIVAYLHRARPAAALDWTVFLRAQAPYRALTSVGVTTLVSIVGCRCGLGPVHAHRLRHSAATGMLAAGASLPEIGQVLRHRQVSTTAIYAKVDHERLRALARPWPAAATR